MRAAIEQAYFLWQQYTRSMIWYWSLPVAALLFFADEQQKYRKKAAVVLGILFVTVYNPVCISLIRSMIGNTATRLYWLFPCWAAMAYILLRVIRIIKKDWIRLMIVTAVCVAVIVSSVPLDSFRLPGNKYQISDTVLILGNTMEEMMDEEGIDEAVVVSDLSFVYTLRQYSARFLLPVSPRYQATGKDDENEFLALEDQLTKIQPYMTESEIDALLDRYEVKFVVTRKTMVEALQVLTDLGWEIQTQYGKYYLLKKTET